MKIIKAGWPFAAIIMVFMFMSAFKYNDQLTDQEKQKLTRKCKRFSKRTQRAQNKRMIPLAGILFVPIPVKNAHIGHSFCVLS